MTSGAGGKPRKNKRAYANIAGNLPSLRHIVSLAVKICDSAKQLGINTAEKTGCAYTAGYL